MICGCNIIFSGLGHTVKYNRMQIRQSGASIYWSQPHSDNRMQIRQSGASIYWSQPHSDNRMQIRQSGARPFQDGGFNLGLISIVVSLCQLSFSLSRINSCGHIQMQPQRQ